MTDEQLDALKEAIGDLIRALLHRLLELVGEHWDKVEWLAEHHWDLLEPVVELGTRKLIEQGVL